VYSDRIDVLSTLRRRDEKNSPVRNRVNIDINDRDEEPS